MPAGRIFLKGFALKELQRARHGTALLSLRREVTGTTPTCSGGHGRSGPLAGATWVAGATSVAPSQPWLALI